MKVLLINGSANRKGSTFTGLSEIAQVLKDAGVESEIWQIGNDPIRDCCGCGACRKIGKCIFEDGGVNELIEKARGCDGFVFGTPVYYAHPSGRILSLLDRAFYAGGSAFAFKPAFALAVARRAGTTASFDVLNKYFTINNMPVVSSNYWNNIHGRNGEDVNKDSEGLQTLRNGARNLVWILKCIESGRQNGLEHPQNEERIWTHFISHD